VRYKNGKDVLPPDLLCEIQKYTCGELLYIPKREEIRASWGQLSGSKEQVNRRNVRIAQSYREGKSVSDLIDEYCLSEASIRKIIYAKC
jgi:Mor family transcriptional regulator